MRPISLVILAILVPVLPILAAPTTRSKNPSPTGRFLHITDIHPDQFYKPGTLLHTACHRRPRRSRKKPPKVGYSGRWGTPDSICDSPESMVEAVFNWISENLRGKIDFVVWTGDNARHDSDNKHPRTEEEIMDMNERTVSRFYSAFGSTFDPARSSSNVSLTRHDYIIPIVPSIGNNDIYPHNIMTGGPRNRALQSFLRLWSAFIPEPQTHSFQEGGYLSIDVIPGRLRVLSLNTMYFYNSNAAVDGCSKRNEPGTDQMHWLETQLERAEKQGVMVYLVGHVAPMKKNYTPSCFRKYASLGFRFQNIIAGHLFGHSNLDHFFVISRDEVEKDDNDDDNDDDDIDAEYVGGGQGGQTVFTVDAMAESKLTIRAGLNTYVETVLERYKDLPSKGDCKDYLIINVNPSIVPTFNPGLRVYEYNLRKKHFGLPLAYTQYWMNLTKWNEEAERSKIATDSGADAEEGSGGEETTEKSKIIGEFEDEEIEDEDEDEEIVHDDDNVFVVNDDGDIDLKKKKKKGKKKKPEKPDDPNDPEEPDLPDHPVPQPVFEVEYTTRDNYGMSDLQPRSWCHLARRIATGDHKLKRQYLEHMFVHTWDGDMRKNTKGKKKGKQVL